MPLAVDVAPDGSIYMDHSAFEQSVLIMGRSGAIKAEIPIPQPGGGNEQKVVVLPDGAIAFDVQRRGQSNLYVGRPGVEPQLLLNGSESAGLPGALLGDDKLAFIIGVPGQPHLAIASLRDGSVIRRFPADARQVTAITVPADGQTIYYASNGTIWAQPVSGGDPRSVSQGYDVAIEPSGRSLYVIRAGPKGYELFRVPASGGEATRAVVPDHFNLTPLGLSSSAVDGGGRILLPVNLSDVFFYRAAIFDPPRKNITIVPVPPRFVVMNSGWTRDGGIAVSVTRWSSSLWRYRQLNQNGNSR